MEPPAAPRVFDATSGRELDVDLSHVRTVEDTRMEVAAFLGVAPLLVNLYPRGRWEHQENMDELPREMKVLLRSWSLCDETRSHSAFVSAIYPREPSSLKWEETLVLNLGGLLDLPEMMSYLVNLRSLFATDNCLQTLPKSIGTLTRLRKIDLSCNQLAFLPEEFTSLVDLRCLILKNNQLRRLPKQSGLLGSLTWVSLDNNLLTALPESFGDLKNLRVLHVKKIGCNPCRRNSESSATCDY